MAMTPAEAQRFANAHRGVAEALERLATVQRWRDRCNIESIADGVTVSWTLGRSVQGYDEIAKIVSRLVAPLLPKLIDEAIKKAEASLHIAQTMLPPSGRTPPQQGAASPEGE